MGNRRCRIKAMPKKQTMTGTCRIKKCKQAPSLPYDDKGVCIEHWDDICDNKLDPKKDIWKKT